MMKCFLGTIVDVSTVIQIVENLEDQFFVLFENDLEIKVGKETDAKQCKSHLFQNKLRKHFNC